MKIVKVLVILFVFISCQKEKNKKIDFIKAKKTITQIDKLTSDKEIENFIRKTDTNYSEFKLKNIQDFKRNKQDSLNRILAKQLQINVPFTKADFDNNGLTDLLAIGDNNKVKSYDDNGNEMSYDFTTIVLMNFKNGFKIIDINKDRFNPIAPKVEYDNNKPFLVNYSSRWVPNQKLNYHEKTRSKLTYKFDDFIEYNENPKKHVIEKIEYSTEPCFGSCPVFKLEINKNRTAIFYAEKYNFSDEINQNPEKTDEGKFKTVISEKEFNELIDILNYIDFSTLQNSYWVYWTDDQRSELKITFDNGKTKNINDYGLIGTYGLKRTYEMLFNLRKNQNWEQIK